jgi:hypothetical protein
LEIVPAAMKNNAAQTCNSLAKLASASVLAAISPPQAVAMSAGSRPAAFWTAEAIPPCSGSTDDQFANTEPVPKAASPKRIAGTRPNRSEMKIEKRQAKPSVPFAVWNGGGA